MVRGGEGEGRQRRRRNMFLLSPHASLLSLPPGPLPRLMPAAQAAADFTYFALGLIL